MLALGKHGSWGIEWRRGAGAKHRTSEKLVGVLDEMDGMHDGHWSGGMALEWST